MPNVLPAFRRLWIVSAILLISAIQAGAQSSTVAPRIIDQINESARVTLQGNTHPLARAEFDQGPAPVSLPMQRMLLILRRSPEQETALGSLLEQQQDNSSPNYHQWLTPEQFGLQFGPADQDIQTITDWLQTHGFEVLRVSKGRTIVEFSGTAAQVQEAFHTNIHTYLVDGETHYANSSDPQIPAAIAPAVFGIRSLHNFRAKPLNHAAGTFTRNKETGAVLPSQPVSAPQFSGGNGCGVLGNTPCEAVGPYDLATIYNVSPLWTAASPIDGTGQTIAIVGQTDIRPSDWAAFWNMFGITTPKGKLNIIVNGDDPGFRGDEPEADIDTQWSSAVAPGATIDFVNSQSTDSTQGVDLSAEYIVDNNLAPVMSESYGQCELFLGTAGNAFFNSLWQQASAQGITVFISSGDQGSAVCDADNPAAKFGLSVNGLGSTPYNVSVGGTDFNQLTTASAYWNTTNTANQANAKGYIPEMTWNDTCTNFEIFATFNATTAEQTCNNPNAEFGGFGDVVAGSGGASNCISATGSSPFSCGGGYPKPSWQNAPGMPADGARDVPDVSLFASNGFNGSFYIVCDSNAQSGVPCSISAFLGFGGTSVAAPIYAGIMALVNQKTGERQGNANYVFYSMAGTAANICNSNTVPTTGTNSCIFYDTPSGSTISVPCVTGSLNCTTVTPGHSVGVLSGYSAAAGYDLATGLGSVNVQNLVNQWSTYAGQFKSTKFSSFTLGPPTTITHGQSIPVAATVVPQTGAGTPNGTVTLIANAGASPSGQQAAPQLFTLSNGSIQAGMTTNLLPGGANYTVTAHYSGDQTFASSDSSPVSVTVTPEASAVQPAIVTSDIVTGRTTNTNATSFPYGSSYVLRMNVTNTNGAQCRSNGILRYACPAGTVTVTDTYKGVTAALDAGVFPLNSEGFSEDQAINLLGGTHTFIANYAGDNSYLPSSNSSAPNVVTVVPAPTLTGPSLGFNGPLIIGSQATLYFQSRTVNPGFYSVPPAGNYTLFDGNTQIPGTFTIGTGVMFTGPGSQDFYAVQTGFIQITVPGPIGPHTFTGPYSGDTNYAASSSDPITVNVALASNTSVASSAPTIQESQSVTFTAIVTSGQPGGPAISGAVQFQTSGVNVGNPVTLINGQAQFTTASLGVGTPAITARYLGDANYAPSSAVFVETVNSITTTTSVTASSASVGTFANVTFTVTVTPSLSSGPNLTGSVRLTANGGTFFAGPISNNQVQATTEFQVAGTESIVATYLGDSNYVTSSANVSVTVVATPTFIVSASPSPVQILSPGGFGSATLTFTGSNGFSGAIAMPPSGPCPALSESTCSFSVASVNLTATATVATAILTIQTTAPSSTFVVPVNRPWSFKWWTPYRLLTLACILCLGILLARSGKKRSRWNAVFTASAIVLIAAISLCGCGVTGGGGGGGGGTRIDPGTAVGTSTISFTFSAGGVTQTLNLPVNVQ